MIVEVSSKGFVRHRVFVGQFKVSKKRYQIDVLIALSIVTKECEARCLSHATHVTGCFPAKKSCTALSHEVAQIDRWHS